jgi:DNA-binding MarR family transcriptional regulator
MMASNIQRLLQILDAAYTKALEDAGITTRQYAAMTAINTLARPSQANVVDATGIDRSTLADIVRRLEKNGHVARKRTKEDARTNELKLTPDGASLLKRASRVVKNVESDFAKQNGFTKINDLVVELLERLQTEAAS